jgi:hypothetical protein
VAKHYADEPQEVTFGTCPFDWDANQIEKNLEQEEEQ